MSAAEKLAALREMARAVAAIAQSIDAGIAQAVAAETPSGAAGALMAVDSDLAAALDTVRGALAFHRAVRS